jgi:hypothetical protein
MTSSNAFNVLYPRIHYKIVIENKIELIFELLLELLFVLNKSIMTKFTSILTRYLYEKDEVIGSFVTSLLKKHNIDECYFWIYEYHYSGFDAFDLLWTIYLDFYGIYNPKFEHFFKRKYKQFIEDKNEESIAYIVRNLYGKKSSPNVFLLRQLYQTDLYPSCIYKGRKPAWVKKYSSDKIIQNLLLAIRRKHWQNITYYIKKNIQNKILPETLYFIIVDYFRNEENISLLDNNKIRDLWDSRIYKNDIHYLLYICHYLYENEVDINKRKIYMAPSRGNLINIKETNMKLPLNRYNNPQNWKTLRVKRRYEIVDGIGSFKLPRFLYSDTQELIRDYWFHWEYYASFSPLWRERIDKLGGKLNSEKRIIEYENEDIEELFYEKYGYELDEQPKEIHDMSLKNIEKSSGNKWISDIFGNFDEFNDRQFHYL